ncbi:AfsA-related hotdog domain-containing protein [Streptomyces sp. NPDC087300]|uniref:AfsA-related hotdog domain-containing protein n=1 Tax=Streptomyces sp. NPDC087300 TaxID=3365780 RepID=UPI00381D9345
MHKAADGEVLLQDAVRTGENRFTVAVRMPRNHFLGQRGAASTPASTSTSASESASASAGTGTGTGTGTATGMTAGDPLLLAEAVRQSAIYLSHRFYGIPEGHAFILSALDFALDEPLPVGGPDAAPLVLEITCVTAPRGPRRLGATLEAEVHRDGRRIGRAGARWQAVDRRQYATLRMRGGGTTLLPEAPAAPHAPSTLLTQPHPPYTDEVLKPIPGVEGQWQVRLDLGHPVLFDHLSDHIPGMVLLEGFRQAALPTDTTLSADTVRSADTDGPLAAAVSFHAFGELTDPPVLVVRQNGAEYAKGADRDAHHFTAVQGGRTIASCTVSVATDRVATDRLATDRLATDRLATDRVTQDRTATAQVTASLLDGGPAC